MKNDSAVSPVIGMIIVIAIVLSVAAIVVSFGINAFDKSTRTKSVAFAVIKVSEPPSIKVTYMGGPDQSDLQGFRVTVDTSQGQIVRQVDPPNPPQGISVKGQSADIPIPAGDANGKVKVLVDGIFRGNQVQKVVDGSF